MSAGVSTLKDTVSAADQACELVAQGMGGVGLAVPDIDIAFVFFSKQHVERAPEMSAMIRRRLNATTIIGVSADSVIGGPLELEGMAGLSIMGARMPGVSVVPFTADDFPPMDSGAVTVDKLGEQIGMSDDLVFSLMLVDPFSVPLIKLLPALHKAKMARSPKAVLFGGLASASSAPGGNALLLDDQILNAGLVGVSLRGKIKVDTVVTQGCKPFGPTFVVTKAKGNLIFELGGKPAIEVIQEAVSEMPEEDREALRQGLFIGRAVSEYRDRFGRDDFLIRSIVNVDPERNAIAVADLIRPGTTIRLHARDNRTAQEDMAMLLDVQKLYDKPRGSLLVTCNGRGRRLFRERHVDSGAVFRAFMPQEGGEQLAKPGMKFDPSGGESVPQVGFFAAGEIGPVAGECYLHGQTACVALFREA